MRTGSVALPNDLGGPVGVAVPGVPAGECPRVPTACGVRGKDGGVLEGTLSTDAEGMLDEVAPLEAHGSCTLVNGLGAATGGAAAVPRHQLEELGRLHE
mmetsp:Transcript_66407/g.158907  ORF Transcript_66407/g.158907 Transcript_66407/m.158907 type:complete len:99 (-) Transcript_66407:112-408(-)